MSSKPEVRRYQMLIDGEWVDALSSETFDSINPYTAKAWATFPEGFDDDIDAAVQAADRAFRGGWGDPSNGSERARLMHRLADLIEEKADEIAVVETTDNGKLIREMSAQLKALPSWYRYFAGIADKIHGETLPIPNPAHFVYTRREPVGVVGGILPWNSPLLLLAHKLAPALAAGCTFVLKPAAQAPASSLEFAKLFAEAGFPSGVFNVVTGASPAVGRALVRHPLVAKVGFTGSTKVGIEVVRDSADHLPLLNLELGGKSANIVFADADLDEAANGVIAGIFAAGGQTCAAGSRVLVHESVHDALVDKVVERAAKIRMGDPLQAETELGPLAFEGHLDRVEEHVLNAVEDGATVATGGHRGSDGPDSEGYFFEPTVLTGVDNRMRVAQNEIFGPVAAFIKFSSEDEAISIANDTPFGLAAGVWTLDSRRAHRVSHQLRAGTVWVNTYRNLNPAVPFGGIGMSGYGRDNGLESVHEYTYVKSVWLEIGGQPRDPFKMG